MQKIECPVCGHPSSKLLRSTTDFRVGFGHKPRAFPAGTEFCELHLQEGLREGHPYHALIDAESTVELIETWLEELSSWLKSNPIDTPGWEGHSLRYHLILRLLQRPGEDIDRLKYFLVITIIEIRGIDLSADSRFH